MISELSEEPRTAFTARAMGIGEAPRWGELREPEQPSPSRPGVAAPILADGPIAIYRDSETRSSSASMRAARPSSRVSLRRPARGERSSYRRS